MENLVEEMAEQIVKLKKENEQLKADIKLDNAFWKQECDSLQKELFIREKALKNSCIKITELDFILNGIIHNDKYWRNKFIKQAKESLK